MTDGAEPEHQSRLGAAKAVAGLAAAAGLLIPAHLAFDLVAPRGRPYLPRLFHQWLTRALGIRIRMTGRPARRQRILFVANHLSWTDIPVLGSRLTGFFVAKTEVGAMPGVRWLADLQRTIYVERERRQASDAQADAIAARLLAGGNVILFPEGTTTADGFRVLPFKSALFASVEKLPDVLVQPVSLAYTRINGLPVTHRRIHEIAWTGDAAFGEHASAFLRLGKVRAEILMHAAVAPADFPDRKALARHCERAVADGYAQLMRA